MSSALASSRRALVALTGLALAVVVVALMWPPAAAHADPYPPTHATTSSSRPAPADPSSKAPTKRTTDDGSSKGLAETGFATLTATILAVGLLGGGVLLVLAGRRRKPRKG